MKRSTGLKRGMLLITASSVAVIIAMPAQAQDRSGKQIDAKPSSTTTDTPDLPTETGDIVVTAQRRGESIQRVPISISAYTQQTLDRQGVRDIQDVARLTPGLNYSRGGIQGLTNISIRGIQSNGGASTTGIYLDDVPIQARRLGFAGGSPFLQAFDLERVEVLRGPQGTLFGAGSEGGTIRFITPQPSLTDYSGYGRGELSATRYGGINFEAGAAVGGPLVQDKLGFRASVWYRDTSGFVDRVDPRTGTLKKKDANSGDALSGKIAVTFAPFENVKITPSFFYQRERTEDTGAFFQPFPGAAPLSDPKAGIFRNGNEIATPTNDKFYVPSLNISVDLTDSISLISATSYLHRDLSVTADYSSVPRALFFVQAIPPAGTLGPNQYTNTQRTLTQEVRVQSTGTGQPLRWVLGAFYQHAKQNAVQVNSDATFASDFQAITGVPFAAIFGPLLPGDILYRQDPYRGIDKQIAGFGQVDFDIIPELTLTAGLRVARTTFDFSTTISGPLGSPVPFTDSGKQPETPVTPKFGIDYRFSPTSNLYASASKGFRVGGFNPRQTAACGGILAGFGLTGTPGPYKSDSVWSYEIGSKNQLFGRKLTVNASAFYIDWNNIQQAVTLPACGGFFIGNLGRAVSKGFDLQASLTPVQGLTLGASIGYTHGEFKDTVFAAGQIAPPAVSKGDRIQGSPWRIALNGEYRHPVGNGNSIYGRVDYQYASKEVSNVFQNNPANGLSFVPFYRGAPQTDFAAVRLGAEIGKLDLSLFVDNLLDATPILNRESIGNTGLFRDSTFRPRTIGLTGTFRY